MATVAGLALLGCPLDYNKFGRGDGSTMAGGFPDESNTGVPAGTELTASGSRTVTTDGAVLENLDVTGCITIRAANVTIRKTRVRCDGDTAVSIESGSALFEDSDFAGTTEACVAAIHGGNFTGRRLKLWGCRRSAWASANSTLENSYLHGLRGPSGESRDAVRVTEGHSITLSHNHIEVDADAQSCVFMKPDGGPIGDVTLTDNLLVGANSTLIFRADGTGSEITNARFTGNRLRGWGLRPLDFVATVIAEWSGNVQDATGETIAKPGS